MSTAAAEPSQDIIAHIAQADGISEAAVMQKFQLGIYSLVPLNWVIDGARQFYLRGRNDQPDSGGKRDGEQ